MRNTTPRTDRMRARHVRSTRRNEKLPSCRRLCQLYADVQISRLTHIIQSTWWRRHHCKDCSCKCLNGCPERTMAQPPSWHVQQIPPFLSYSDEPAFMGCRNLVTMVIATWQTRGIPSPKHLMHSPDLNDNSTRTSFAQWKSTRHVLFHPLRKKHDCG